MNPCDIREKIAIDLSMTKGTRDRFQAYMGSYYLHNRRNHLPLPYKEMDLTDAIYASLDAAIAGMENLLKETLR